MFYDNFIKLCKQKGVTPSAVMRTIGLNKSSASYWKKGTTPSSDTLRKLADYFGVSMDYLSGNVWDPKYVLRESDALGITGHTVLPDDLQVGKKEIIFGNGPHKYVRTDDFEEGLNRLSNTARSALEPPKVADAKEQLFNIVEELSDEDLETLVKFALFVKYRQQEAQNPPEAPPAPAGDTEHPRRPGRARGGGGGQIEGIANLQHPKGHEI